MTRLAIRVILIEDHFLARMALRSVLSGRSDIVIVGEASEGASGIELFRETNPDVTVMDLRLPGVNGFEAIAAIRKLTKTAKIVVLSNYEGSEDIYRAIRNGAMAYLTKNTSGEELVEAIVTVHRGMRYLPPIARDRLAERTSLVELTPREHEVLTYITRGQSNRDIANQLRIAEKTVRIHVSSVLDKMGVRDRTQAAIYAIQRGLVHWE
jgi:DNA-binding NarL/FixJ family response regulator